MRHLEIRREHRYARGFFDDTRKGLTPFIFIEVHTDIWSLTSSGRKTHTINPPVSDDRSLNGRSNTPSPCHADAEALYLVCGVNTCQ